MSEMEYPKTLLAAAIRTYLYIEPHLVAISPEAPRVALQLCRPFVNEEEGKGFYPTYRKRFPLRYIAYKVVRNYS